jgi:hypothetical protein
LAHVFADATPFKVRGDVEYLVNRNENGWVITLINNNGVFKPQQGLAQVDRTASVTATISFPRQSVGKVLNWNTDKDVEIQHKADDDSVTLRIPPGDLAIVELQLAKK